MIRAFLLKNLLNASRKNKKRLKFFADVGIFLIIAALISSGISIYFENKLSKYKSELVKLELQEFKIQEWLTDAPSKIWILKLVNLHLILLKQMMLSISVKEILLLFTNLVPIHNTLCHWGYGKNSKRRTQKQISVKKNKEENEEALEFIYDVYEKFPPNEDEYLEVSEIEEIEEVLKKWIYPNWKLFKYAWI